jgi:hypothetical protein
MPIATSGQAVHRRPQPNRPAKMVARSPTAFIHAHATPTCPPKGHWDHPLTPAMLPAAATTQGTVCTGESGIKSRHAHGALRVQHVAKPLLLRTKRRWAVKWFSPPLPLFSPRHVRWMPGRRPRGRVLQLQQPAAASWPGCRRWHCLGPGGRAAEGGSPHARPRTSRPPHWRVHTG